MSAPLIFGPDRTLTAFAAELLAASGGAKVQRVMMFGSRARGAARAESDLDLLVLVEVDAATWSPSDNVAERRRLERIVQPAIRARLDLWVRTVDQFAEAKAVIGSVEHLASDGGVTLWARPPTRAPLVRRSRDQVRCSAVLDALADSLSLLGASVRCAAHRAASAHYAARADERAMLALYFWHQVKPPDKRAGRAMLVDRLAAFEPAVARTTEHHRHCDAGARASRELLLTVVDRLATEPELRFGARVLRARIARPLAELADSPPLK